MFFASGQLELSVKDPSGAAMEASGKLDGVPFQTNPQGSYTFDNLAPGRYRLEVSKTGFAPEALLIDIHSDDKVTRTVTLSLGPTPASTVTVVGTTPLPGADLQIGEIPAPTQTASENDIETSGAIDLSSFLNRRLLSVHVNEVQGNPFQPDVNYRGYTASPLLGTPQGLSVYMDGVRLNQPFGDVMSWDLIPKVAVAETTLIPGSNPLFGLNTLGGALSLRTKNGASHPGTTVQIVGGSYARRAVEFEHGGSNDAGLNWFLAGNFFKDDGWRESSPTTVRQLFSKVGWNRSNTVLGLTVAYANNALIGNGLQDYRLLDRNYGSVYTKPDKTDNRSPFVNFNAQHSLTHSVTVSGNVYYRDIRTHTFNGDINEEALDQALYQPNAAERAALAAAGYTGFPESGETAANTPFPSWRCIANTLLNDEPSEKCNGLINRGYSKQRNYGFSGQLSWFTAPGVNRNQLTVGAAYDRSNVDYFQSSQLGYLNPDRSVAGLNAFGDGVTGGDADGEPFDTRVDIYGRPRTASVFATDTLSVGSKLNFTLSGRYNRTTIENSDRILPGGGPGSLDGLHRFHRFNPAAGVTFRPWRTLNTYFSYSEGNRAPTSIELGCADPNQPCKLPNAMAGDPPLNQVVTRTFEAGVRDGGQESFLSWNAGWFHSDSRDDILFVASQQTGYGYFKNFEKTRRQGMELGGSARLQRVTLSAGYTFLDATYQSIETVNGESNSSNNEALEGERGMEGVIDVAPGNQIPLIPRHMGKAFAHVQVTSRLSLGLGMLAFSSSYARGNENNQHQADGTYYLGSGETPGYAVFNLGADYRLTSWLQLVAQIDNLFDRRYYTAGQLGPAGFTENGNFLARPLPPVDGEYPLRHTTFYAPGAPRIVWGGLRFRF